MRDRLRLAGIAAGVLAIAACGSNGSTTTSSGSATATGSGSATAPASGSASPAAAGGTVYVLAGTAYSYLDPASGYDSGVEDFYRLIYRTLTTYAAAPGAAGEQVVGDLATNTGTPSDNYKTWTFTLRKGLVFQNGQPITSQDLKFGVERAWDPTAGIGDPTAKQLIVAPSSYKGPYQSGSLPSTSIDTPDSATIIFHLTASTPNFDVQATSPDFVAVPAGSGKGGVFNTSPISSGPYEVSSFKHGSSLTLVRNPHWQQSSDPVRAAKPDSFVFQFGLSEATIDQRVIADQAKDVDAITIDQMVASAVPKLSTVPGRYVQGTENCTYFTVLNTAKAPLDNLKVRQAIEWATDKQTVVDATGGSVLASPATSIEPPGTLGRNPVSAYPTATGDVAKAKALLAAAGYAKGFTMTLQTDSGYQPMAVAVQAALARVGITVKIQTIASDTYWQTIETPTQEAQSAIGGWCGNNPDATNFLSSMFDGDNITKTGNSDWSMLNDKALNSEMTALNAMTDINALNAKSAELDLKIQQLAPIVPLLYMNWVTLFGSNVTGVYPSGPYSAEPDLVSVGLKNPGA
jgi:peptide/nickel transport system substrate-binding protein